jgi:hypothetical protein
MPIIEPEIDANISSKKSSGSNSSNTKQNNHNTNSDLITTNTSKTFTAKIKSLK